MAFFLGNMTPSVSMSVVLNSQFAFNVHTSPKGWGLALQIYFVFFSRLATSNHAPLYVLHIILLWVMTKICIYIIPRFSGSY